MTISDRRRALAADAARAGMYVRTYSPGDGIVRYRFFVAGDDEPSTYFGPASGIHTALGLAEAEAFVRGALTSAPAERR